MNSASSGLEARAASLVWQRVAGVGADDGAPLVLSARWHRALAVRPGEVDGPWQAAPALLHPLPGPVAERWCAGPDMSVQAHAGGGVHWRSDGRWTVGTACIDDAASGGVEAATEAAYLAVFAALRDSATPHLLRLWNYLPRINAVDAGLERYRHFNVGRQRAFLAAGHRADVGTPAACALGTDDGALTVHFLAGQQPARAVENPRQVSAYRYPASYGPVSPGFSRAALVEIDDDHEALLISGTASIVGHATLHAGDVRRQTAETIANLRAVVDAANGRAAVPTHRVEALDATVYLRDADDLATVRDEIARALGADSHFARSAIYLRADVCRADLAVEIEAQHLAMQGRA